MTLFECLLCGTGTQASCGICPDCVSTLPLPQRPCRRCSVELPESGPWQEFCESCLLTPPAFDRCLSAFRYEFPVRELVAAFKFQADFATGRALAQLCASRLSKAWENTAPTPVLIPVPLHTGRLRERGFNQSVLIARALASRCGLAINLHHCRRIRATLTQRGLRASERGSNLEHAFAIAEPRRVFSHVVIVDDVVTTKATVESVARLYRRAGTRRVDIACIARVS